MKMMRLFAGAVLALCCVTADAGKDARLRPHVFSATQTAAHYDGISDFFLRGADLTGIADGKLGTVSAWVRMGGGDGTTVLLLNQGTGNATGIQLRRNASNQFQVLGANTANTVINLFFSPSATVTAGSGWHHVLAWWDLGSGVQGMRLDGVLQTLSGTTLTNDVLDYTRGNFSVAAGTAGASKLNGCMSNIYFNPLVAISDVSKFRTPYGHPAYLGPQCRTPSGDIPLLCSAVGSGGDNQGTGGKFTATGAPTTCSSAP